MQYWESVLNLRTRRVKCYVHSTGGKSLTAYTYPSQASLKLRGQCTKAEPFVVITESPHRKKKSVNFFNVRILLRHVALYKYYTF